MLLFLCLGVVFVMANVVVGRTVMRGFGESRTILSAAEAERQQQLVWLKQRDAWLPRYIWLDETMPGMTSSSKAGAQLLSEMQDAAHERELRLPRQNMLEAQTTEFYHEVSVQLQIEGELEEVTNWLSSLQRPEAFSVIKQLEISLDTKSKEKKPQARCNLVLARWFSPHAHAHGDEPEPESEPETEPTEAKPTPEAESETDSAQDESSRKLTRSE